MITKGIISVIHSGQRVTRQRSKKENPIIIIPGVMGSRLFSSSTKFDESTQIWDPKASISGVWGFSSKLEEPVYVRPFTNQNYDRWENAEKDVKLYGREYGTQQVYEEIVKDLCGNFPNRKVFFFSYNWMESNTESAKKLHENISSLNEEKVDLVCHSMGGFVASRYYKEYGKHRRVEKIITCATPYEGAPKLINSIMNWDILGEGIVGENAVLDLALGLLGGIRKDLKASFIGVAELTPTKSYVSVTPMKKSHSILSANREFYEPAVKDLTYDEYVKHCEAIFNKKNSQEDTYKKIREFQASLLDVKGDNALLDYENAYFVIGVNQKTITSIRFNEYDADVEKRLYETDLEYEVLGDGTVPYLSSSIMKRITEGSLDEKKWATFTADHTEIIKKDNTIEWITDILKQGFSMKDKDGIEYKKYTVVRVACPVDITVAYNGELLASKAGQTAMAASFGRMDVIGRDNEIKMICMEARDDYSIILNGTGKGTMDYSIRFFDETGIMGSESNFTNVPITEKTIIYTGTNQESGIVLNIDSDGDGIMKEIRPSSREDQFIEANTLKGEGAIPSSARYKEYIGTGIGKDWNENQDYGVSVPDEKRLLERLIQTFLKRRKSCEQLHDEDKIDKK